MDHREWSAVHLVREDWVSFPDLLKGHGSGKVLLVLVPLISSVPESAAQKCTSRESSVGPTSSRRGGAPSRSRWRFRPSRVAFRPRFRCIRTPWCAPPGAGP